MRVTFQEVSARRTVKVACIACGKQLSRTIKEWQTVNPYNRTPDGSPKTELQIYAELPAMLDKAEQELKARAICRACEALGHRINWFGQHIRPEESPLESTEAGNG